MWRIRFLRYFFLDYKIELNHCILAASKLDIEVLYYIVELSLSNSESVTILYESPLDGIAVLRNFAEESKMLVRVTIHLAKLLLLTLNWSTWTAF